MMAKEAHTPGPWKIDGATVFALDERGHVNRFSARVQGGYVSYLRSLPRSKAERTSDAELEANARLIAAAPELLDALEGLAGEVGKMTADRQKHRLMLGRLCEAKLVIAKARGEAA